MNVFACPTCNSQQSVPADSAGKQIACSQCGAAMAIPVNASVTAQPPAAAMPQPAPEKPKSGQVVMRRRRRVVPYIVLTVLFIIIAVAFYTNPSEERFREQTKDDRSFMEKAVGKFIKGEILLEKNFERKNNFIFSVGTITIRHRITGEKARFDVIGAFGKWWLQYPINVSGELIRM